MVNEEQRQHISNLLAAARAQLELLKKDVADMKRAGLVSEASPLEKQMADQETRIVKLESVYGRR